MARARIDESVGRAAVRGVLADHAATRGDTARGAANGAGPDHAATRGDRDTLALATRYLLQVLAEGSPGRSVEVRVPPFGAVQAVEGVRHTRGTPPNVVELDAETFVAIATGGLTWGEAAATGRVHASGARSDLSSLFPLPF